MIPSLVVDELRTSLIEYLASSFALTDDDVHTALEDFLRHQSDGVFRGPYLRVRTPFVTAPDTWTSPLDWLPDGFSPYHHQAEAFARLSSRHHEPQPTIVTTGTGSGKTECFLYPVLDDCIRHIAAGELRQPHGRGIRALLIYPMNALATDQAERLAALIERESALAGIRAGLYLGEDGHHTTMGPDHLIDAREALRRDPPDILLTNYKMLDYLLLRPEDRDLWALNGPDTLRYVVLDEFHTYDGAQGTDVAMLLRRLGHRLQMATADSPLGSAAPVATSATLTSAGGGTDDLRRFARRVFGREFDENSVIGETRQSIDESTKPTNFYLRIPPVDEVLAADGHDEVAALFCTEDRDGATPPDVADAVALGDILLAHPLTRAVLATASVQPRTWGDAVREVVSRAAEWGRTAMTEPGRVEDALARYLWLLSLAKRDVNGVARPLFTIEVQLWVREVSRLLRTVGNIAEFRWMDSAARDTAPDAPPTMSDAADDESIDSARPAFRHELPAIYCRRCGMSGWMTVESALSGTMHGNPRLIYRTAAERQSTVRALIRANPADETASWYDPATGAVSAQRSEGTVAVFVTPDEDAAKNQTCPACEERDAIRFLGLRVASLSSVSINTLFASRHVEEDERKLLAFTDSVQDASHRAGFYSGRTHRIGLRTRMASVVGDHAPEDGSAMSLADLGDELIAQAAGDPRRMFELTPPDLMRDRRVATTWTDDVDPAGIDILARRTAFEVDLEFGLRSRIGRTLELSGAVVAAVEPVGTAITALVAEDLSHHLGAHFGRLDVGGYADGSLQVYIRGLLERLRLRGALVNQLLDRFINTGGARWEIWGGRPDGLPAFPAGQSSPAFAILSTGTAGGDFDALTSSRTRRTWFVDWAVRTLGVDDSTAGVVNGRVMAVLASATDAVVERSTPKGRVFGLDRRFVIVADLVDDAPSGLQCSVCGNRHTAAPVALDTWVGTPCLRYRCTGTYEARTRSQRYYRDLYRGRINRRVVATEHTGLLNRAQREAVEIAFKRGTAPDAPNVLAATPTLEMGIDIGDLSAVMLTSVPPNPAAYAQRTGRAGRHSGNSLVTTFVATDSHGLYYLAEPEAMLAGTVRPPNCHLDAFDSLRRQYLAYLVDRLTNRTLAVGEPAAVASDISLPRNAQAVLKNGLDPDSMLQTLVRRSMLDPALIDEFLALFDGAIEPGTVQRMREFATAGIERQVKAAVESWNDEIDQLVARRRNLQRRVLPSEVDGATPSPEAADEQRTLRGELAALARRLNDRREEYAPKALERIGLLPNYALIDDSIELVSTLWSRENDDRYVVDEFEFQRSGAHAIVELAPANSFYAEGHRHVIDAIDIGTPSEPAYETWYLCAECSYGTTDADGLGTVCPRCASPSLRDMGARLTMLRLRRSYSSGSEESARVFDEDDDRVRRSYSIAATIDVDTNHVSEAWQLESTAFGAEFATGAHLRTINLGIADRPTGAERDIAGSTHRAPLFHVCRFCGAVAEARSDNGGRRPDRLHQGWCPVRGGKRAEANDAVALYHELVTDVVRIAVPVSMFEVRERLASLTAALLLGIRSEFGGNPDHLRIAHSSMPNPAGQGRRNYLVLYDAVPGGTGYLADMSSPDSLHRILTAARDAIGQCVCVREARQACHRCLLGVVDRREYDAVTRSLALSVLNDLLDGWTVEPVETVTAIDMGRTEESELERRFKAALHAWADRTEGVTMQQLPPRIESGRTLDAFELRMRSGSDTIRYRIDEQVGLGTTPQTVPDFIISRQDQRARLVAIYLDGLQFHASLARNNLAKDAAQRRGVRRDAWVWNLTWDDVDTFHRQVVNDRSVSARRSGLLPPAAVHAAKDSYRQLGGGPVGLPIVDENPVDTLLGWLAHPDQEVWERLALACAVGLGSIAPNDSTGALPAVGALAELEAMIAQQPPVGPGGAGTSHRFAGDETSPTVARSFRTIGNNGLPIGVLLRTDRPADTLITVVLSIDDRDEVLDDDAHRARWRDWLAWANIFQFLTSPGRDAIIAARSDDAASLAEDTYLAAAVNPHDAVGPTESEPTDPRWGERSIDLSAPAAREVFDLTTNMEQELDLIDESGIRIMARAALVNGAPDLIAGFEVPGHVPLPVGWPDKKVGLIDASYAAAPMPPGWTIFEIPAEDGGPGRDANVANPAVLADILAALKDD